MQNMNLTESDNNRPSKFGDINPDEATNLLKRRLVTIGGVVGGLMGLLWSVVAGLLFPGFPPLNSVFFLVLAFVAVVILGGAGLLVGRYAFTRIMAGK